MSNFFANIIENFFAVVQTFAFIMFIVTLSKANYSVWYTLALAAIMAIIHVLTE